VAEAFRMNRFEGKKYIEIAREQNVSVRTIEVRIGKALNLLRKLLKDFLITALIILSSLAR
jgi:RNA polymerase sigma-70 factor, ECF subfamily